MRTPRTSVRAMKCVRRAPTGPPPARGRRAKSKKRSIKLDTERREPSAGSQAQRAKRREPSAESQAQRAKLSHPSAVVTAAACARAISFVIQSPGHAHARLVAPAQAGAQRILPRAWDRRCPADGRHTSGLARPTTRGPSEADGVASSVGIPNNGGRLGPAPRLRQKRKHRVRHTVRTTGPMASANQLAQMVGREGFEPSTYGLKVRSSTAELTTR